MLDLLVKHKATTMTIKRILTGIHGLDGVLEGGYPTGNTTLLKGGPGTGKTVFCLCLAHSQLSAGESAIIATCEEAPERLVEYMDAFGFDGTAALASGRLTLIDLRPSLAEDEVVGAYELSAVLLRISHALEQTKAKVLCVDSLQSMLLGFNRGEPRVELLRLFDWVRESGITTLVTASLTMGTTHLDLLEEYTADCVIYLDQRIEDLLMTRYLRIVKLRGARHGTNEYPFSLTGTGVSLLPITTTRMMEDIRTGRISTGIEDIDALIGGTGYSTGSTVMFSGRSGTGKTVFVASLAAAAARQGHRVHLISFEESADGLVNNLKSAGIDFGSHLESGSFRIEARRAVEMGMEDHLISIINTVEREEPDLLVLDPVSSLADMGTPRQIKMLLIRFLSHIQNLGVTLLLTELLPDAAGDQSQLEVSSLADTWFRLRQVESNGEFNRMLYVVKSRGAATSNQIKEFVITDDGIRIEEPYIGDGTIEFGTTKRQRIEQDQDTLAANQFDMEQAKEALASLELSYESRLKALESEFNSNKNELKRKLAELERRASEVSARREIIEKLRG
ncbi:MAG: circadian clock protein KaiC [Candidatus Thiodiazotropha endolucinida]